jgi:hypothetical protein
MPSLRQWCANPLEALAPIAGCHRLSIDRSGSAPHERNKKHLPQSQSLGLSKLLSSRMLLRLCPSYNPTDQLLHRWERI